MSNAIAPATSESRLLDQIRFFIDHFLLIGSHELITLTLWVAHNWVIDAFDVTPYLAITSPTMREGKSRLLEILALLVPNPIRGSRITGPALYRKLRERPTPTLLLDE